MILFWVKFEFLLIPATIFEFYDLEDELAMVDEVFAFGAIIGEDFDGDS